MPGRGAAVNRYATPHQRVPQNLRRIERRIADREFLRVSGIAFGKRAPNVQLAAGGAAIELDLARAAFAGHNVIVDRKIFKRRRKRNARQVPRAPSRTQRQRESIVVQNERAYRRSVFLSGAVGGPGAGLWLPN